MLSRAHALQLGGVGAREVGQLLLVGRALLLQPLAQRALVAATLGEQLGALRARAPQLGRVQPPRLGQLLLVRALPDLEFCAVRLGRLQQRLRVLRRQRLQLRRVLLLRRH